MADDPYIQFLFAERIGGARYGKDDAIYKFEKIKRAKQAAKVDQPDVELIDMGVGEPDEMAFAEVVSVLQDEAARPENRGYADNGGSDFKVAAARHMDSVYGVSIDPETEVCHSIGSKAALSLIPACFINPGDYVLMTTPGYPVFGTHAKYYGGNVFNYPLTQENGFLPDLESAPSEILTKAKVLVLNYPNNPTGASATREFFERAVAFAKAHHLVILQDAAYSALVFDDVEPLSILQVPGGKEVAVELHSLSKSYNMTGWRIGFVCGNPLMVRAYSDVKDNSDSGQFLAIQKAAAAALNNPSITREIAEKYSRRMDLLVAALKESGFNVEKPRGSFFLYAPIPRSASTPGGEKVTFADAEAFSQFLIRELLISTVPWDDAGHFVRFSVTFSARGKAAEEATVDEIKRRLDSCGFEF